MSAYNEEQAEELSHRFSQEAPRVNQDLRLRTCVAFNPELNAYYIVVYDVSFEDELDNGAPIPSQCVGLTPKYGGYLMMCVGMSLITPSGEVSDSWPGPVFPDQLDEVILKIFADWRLS